MKGKLEEHRGIGIEGQKTGVNAAATAKSPVDKAAVKL